MISKNAREKRRVWNEAVEANPVTCRRCHQRLRRPLSLARGYGPVCWLAEGKQLSLFDDEPTLAQIADEAYAIRQENEARERLEGRTR